MIKCIYPGSFDPFHLGHLDVLLRACSLFDHVVVAVLHNSAKRCSFALEERLGHIQRVIESEGLINAEAACFQGLLADYARSVNANCVLRGVRTTMDYEYELAMAHLNKRLDPHCETVFFPAHAEHFALSSSMVREIGRFGGDISPFVPEINRAIIAERLLGNE